MRKDHKKDNQKLEGPRHHQKVAFTRQGEEKLDKGHIEGQNGRRKTDDIKGKDIDLMNYTDL